MKWNMILFPTFCLFFIAFFNNNHTAIGSETIELKAEVKGYQTNALSLNMEDFHQFYDASIIKIIEPSKYTGEELKILFQVFPKPNNIITNKDIWKKNGEFITFTIDPLKLERGLRRKRTGKRGFIYYFDISINKSK